RSGEAGWLPVGDEYPPGALLSLERLSETIRAIRPAGGVVVVDVPALGAGPEGVVAAGASDVILLALQQNRTTWAQLERSLEVLTAANAQGRVCICLDGRPPSRDAIDMLSWGFVEPQQVRAPTALRLRKACRSLLPQEGPAASGS